MTKYAQYNPDWTEQMYSRSVYPVLSTAVGFLPSLVGFSVTEWLVTLFLLFCLGYIAYYVRKVIISKDGRSMTAYHGVAGAAAIFCMVYFVFTAFCGRNYHRYTFTYYTGYDVEQSNVEELEQLCTSLAEDMGRVREQLGEDTDRNHLKYFHNSHRHISEGEQSGGWRGWLRQNGGSVAGRAESNRWPAC